MNMENLILNLFVNSVNIMRTDNWKWPDEWTIDRKIKFLSESLSYAEKHELYEQCSILRDAKNKIETTK